MNDEQIRARTIGRIVNALNQFKRELASDGVDVSKSDLPFVIDALANYTPTLSEESEDVTLGEANPSPRRPRKNVSTAND